MERHRTKFRCQNGTRRFEEPDESAEEIHVAKTFFYIDIFRDTFYFPLANL